MKQNLTKDKTKAMVSVTSVSSSVPMADVTLLHSFPLDLYPVSEPQQRLWSPEWGKAGEQL